MSGTKNFFAPEMAHDVIETDTFLWSSRICDTIVALCVTLLLVDHIYNVFIAKSISTETPSRSGSRQRTGTRTRTRTRTRSGSSMRI